MKSRSLDATPFRVLYSKYQFLKTPVHFSASLLLFTVIGILCGRFFAGQLWATSTMIPAGNRASFFVCALSTRPQNPPNSETWDRQYIR